MVYVLLTRRPTLRPLLLKVASIFLSMSTRSSSLNRFPSFMNIGTESPATLSFLINSVSSKLSVLSLGSSKGINTTRLLSLDKQL